MINPTKTAQALCFFNDALTLTKRSLPSEEEEDEDEDEDEDKDKDEEEEYIFSFVYELKVKHCKGSTAKDEF